MKSLKDIVGLPVLLDGACIGHALYAEPNSALEHVQALWFSTGSMGARRIDRAHIFRIGEVAIQVGDRGKRARPSSVSIFRRAISTDGARLGAIVDADFDDQLMITSLWLSCGYPDDLFSGRRKIPRYSVRESDGAVLIPSGEEDEA